MASNGNSAEQVILDAALAVVAEKSIIGTRMHLIAKKAGMAQSNLHYYYKTKHDLLVALYQKLHQDFEDGRKRACAKKYAGLKERLQAFFEQKKKTILKKPTVDYAQFDYWSQGRSDAEIREMFAESHDMWRDEMVHSLDEYSPGLQEKDLRMISYVMVSMMMGASLQYLNKPGLFDLDDYFATCADLILHHLDTLKNGKDNNA